MSPSPHRRSVLTTTVIGAVVSLVALSVYQELTSDRISCGNLDAARHWLWERTPTIDNASPAAQCEFFAKGKAIYAAMKLCVADFKYDPAIEARIAQTIEVKKAQCGW